MKPLARVLFAEGKNRDSGNQSRFWRVVFASGTTIALIAGPTCCRQANNVTKTSDIHARACDRTLRTYVFMRLR